MGPMGDTLRFTKRDQDVLIHTVVEPMASEGLRTICIAYRDFPLAGAPAAIACHVARPILP